MLALLTQGDLLSRLVAWVLLLMSVASWVLILWKTALLWRISRGLPRSLAAFWQAQSLQEAGQRLAVFDHARVLSPLLQAVQLSDSSSLSGQGEARQRLTRGLRDALHGVLHRLQYGQIVLASVGATAPFVGLLGTVWGIYHALMGLGLEGQIRLEQIAGPVGEALIMTAAGLAVAIPAVLAYNALGRQVWQLEAQLEGFAHDLRELRLGALADRLEDAP
jgi:biopolymer transport protein ExbB